MNRITLKLKRHKRRRRTVRKRIFGLPTCPRLTVTRSGKNIYAQLIDDTTGRTICSASTIQKDERLKHGGNCAAAKEIGTKLAEKAKSVGVEQVVFDRKIGRAHV